MTLLRDSRGQRALLSERAMFKGEGVVRANKRRNGQEAL
jgi:hypothetical protein